MKQLTKKVFIILAITILQFLVYFNIEKTNADAEKIGTWDISYDSSSNVTATLYNDGKLIISGNGKMKDYDYVEQEYNIPYISENVLEVEIESGITSIGRYSFFKGSKIKKINILGNIEQIEDNAFQYCEALEEINLPNGLEKIGQNAFADCKKIKEIEIPSSVKEIGEHAFKRCIVLEKINIPSGLELLEENPFFRCTNLKNLNFDSENTNFIYEDGMLMNKDKTRLIFCSKDKVGTLNIIDTIKEIDDCAIFNCDLLQEINIPISVEKIGNVALGFCDKLTSINIDQNNENFIMDKGILYNKEKTRILICSRDKQEESYQIPSTVETIDQSAFLFCDVIKNIGLLENLSIINRYTFYNCKSLENITLSNSIIEIDEYAFYGCKVLQEINIPESVKKIGVCAFADCDLVQEINIPSGVEEIGNSAFGFCEVLTSITIDQNNEKFIMEKGILYDKDKTRILICSRDKQEESYQIPSTVETIDKSAFANCNTIKSVILPEGITKIERSTFYNCTELENINIPNTVISIFPYAFGKCNKLKTISIPKSVEEIMENAFSECELEKVYISSKHKDYAIENDLPYEIDDTSPEIDRIEGNLTEKTSENVVLKVTASDNQSGLAMSAYSFDNGETWQESNEKIYSKNTQGIIIKVRDKIGNETTYEEEININNIEKIIKELKIKQMPNKLEYIKGENLDLTGIVLEVEYEDDTKEKITEGFTVDKENLDTLGTVEITINYENVSTTFNVNVSEKQDEEKQDEDKQDEDKQDEDKQDEDKQDEDKQDEDKQDEDKQDEDKQDEDKQDEDKQDKDKQDEDKQDEDKQDEDKQDEDKQDEDKQDEDKQDGEKPDTANNNNVAKNTITNLSNSKLPYTGLMQKLMPISIIITLSVAIVTCIGYIKYKNLK